MCRSHPVVLFQIHFFILPHLSQHPSMLSGVFTSIGPKLIRSIPWDKSKFYASKSQPIFTIEAWNKGLCVAFAQIFCFKCTRLWLFFICLPTWPCYLAYFLASARNRWDWYHVIGANFMQMILFQLVILLKTHSVLSISSCLYGDPLIIKVS